jgi:ribosomal protein S18 acetylase RimI-like enzyme
MSKGGNPLIIKRLEYEDFIVYEDKIFDLLVETYLINFGISPEQSKDISLEKVKHLESYIKESSAIVIGACEDEALIGFIWLYKHSFFGEKRLHVNQIAVDGLYRGKGIGKRLIQEAENQASKECIKYLDLFVSEANSNAFNLYDRLGFETERRYMKKKL